MFGHVCMKLCPKVTWGSDSVTDRRTDRLKLQSPAGLRLRTELWSANMLTRQQLSLLEQTLTELQRAVTFSDCTSVTIKFSHSKYFPSLKFWIPSFAYAPFGCNYRNLLTGDGRGAHVFSWVSGWHCNFTCLTGWHEGMWSKFIISINTLNLKFTVKCGLIVADRKTLIHVHIFQFAIKWYSIWMLNNKKYLFPNRLVR